MPIAQTLTFPYYSTTAVSGEYAQPLTPPLA